jgi:uncharacterized protein
VQPNHRRCISCRRTAHRQEFWRIVRRHPDRQICLDQGMGRSAYLCPNPDCLKLAQKKGRLGRALRAPVPEALFEQLQQRLVASASTAPSPPDGILMQD